MYIFFSDIHRSMNAMVHVQSKWRRQINFAQDPLRSYLDECQKNKIHLLHVYLRNYVEQPSPLHGVNRTLRWQINPFFIHNVAHA